MKPIERVKKVIELHKMSVSAFEKATGMSNNSIQTALKRNSNLKDDTLNSILNRFTDISAEWLLTGNGSMLKSKNDDSEILKEPEAAYRSEPREIDLLLDKIKYLEEQIQWFKNHIEFLTEQLSIKHVLDKQRIQDVFEKMNKIEKEEEEKEEKEKKQLVR
jgi:transcriptional regulator with XRE-family HTH domain